MKLDKAERLPLEIEKVLPRCSGCLCDFLASTAMRRLPCGHAYCSDCLQKLQVQATLLQCLLDKSPCSEDQVVQLTEQIAHLLEAPDPTAAEFQALLVPRNVNKVACRDLFNTGMCDAASDCEYSHSGACIETVRKFQLLEPNSACWECSNCLLVVSKKLMQCPVCDMKQVKGLAMLKAMNDRKESQAFSTQACDQSMQTEADRSALKSLHSPAAVEAVSENEDERLVMPKRSACCILQ